MNLPRYLNLYGALWKNSVTREMGFKANFLLWIVVDALWFALQLCFMAVLYSHTERIGDWTKWQVVLLVGTAHFIQQVFTAFFLNNLVALSDLIRTGRLDFFLLLPVNTRFIVSLRQVDLGSYVNAVFGLAVIAYACRQLGLVPDALQVLGFIVLCACSVLAHASLMLLLACVSFWTVKAQGIVWGYYNLFMLARWPDAAFRAGAFKAFFTFVLPMLLVSNVPARLLIDTLKRPLDLLLLLGISLACFAVSEVAWRFSLRRYTSASS